MFLILRLQYKKNGMMKFNAHLDMVRLFERALRRAMVPLKFSQGYNPHPKMSFAAPLSVGVSSDYELIDIELTEKANIKSLIDNQDKIFPEGIELVRGKHLDDSKALMSMLDSSVFLLRFNTLQEQSYEYLDASIGNFLAQEKIEYVKKSRKGKNDKETIVDIRPHIHNMTLVDNDGKSIILKLLISQGSVFNLKPEVVLERFVYFGGFEIDETSVRLHRLMMNGKESGNNVELYDMF